MRPVDPFRGGCGVPFVPAQKAIGEYNREMMGPRILCPWWRFALALAIGGALLAARGETQALTPEGREENARSTSARSVGAKGALDPLSPEERRAASRSALEELLPTAVRANPPADLEEFLAALPGYELLLVETERWPAGRKARNRSARPRRAVVWVYEYPRDITHRLTVSLTEGRDPALYDHFETRGAQLPLTERESRRALDLALADGPTRRVIRERYRLGTGEALQNASLLNVKAFIFRADAMPTRSSGAKSCGLERCAQLVIYAREATAGVAERLALGVLPVVNLSTGEVLELERRVRAASPANADHVHPAGARP